MIKYRPHSKKDIPYRVQWFNNPKANRFISDESNKKTTLSKETKWFNNYQKDNNKKFFTIIDNKLPIGCVGLTGVDRKHKQAELFIIIGNNEYFKRGIGKQSLEFILDYGFKKLNLHKISLGVFEKNKQAIKSFKSVGFVVEGVLKDDVLINGRFYNMILMAKFNKRK